MPLSPEVQQRLARAREKQFINPRNPETLQAISQRAVRAIVGPFESGKTTVSLIATVLDPGEFHYTPSRTTRELRDDEPAGTIRPILNTNESVTALLDEVERGEFVQYAIHPTEGTFYGTKPQDYHPTKYNLIPMLAGRPTDYLIGSPWRDAQVIGIVSTPGALEHRITKAYYGKPDKLPGRLREGIASTDFLIDRAENSQAILVHNIEGNLIASAQALMQAVRGKQESNTHEIAYLRRTRTMFERMLRKLGEDHV